MSTGCFGENIGNQPRHRSPLAHKCVCRTLWRIEIGSALILSKFFFFRPLVYGPPRRISRPFFILSICMCLGFGRLDFGLFKLVRLTSIYSQKGALIRITYSFAFVAIYLGFHNIFFPLNVFRDLFFAHDLKPYEQIILSSIAADEVKEIQLHRIRNEYLL